jgi:guanylate kinase
MRVNQKRTTPAGKILIISGPSGVGKTTLVRSLLRLPGFLKSVSMTTRPPRHGEVDGRDYAFISPRKFKSAVARGELLEHAVIHGDWYGTPRKPVEGALLQGRTVVLDVDVQGARSVRRAGLPCFCVFIMPPSLKELERRLAGRRSETPETLARRLGHARSEMNARAEYDAVLINRHLNPTVERLVRLLRRHGICCGSFDRLQG